MGNEIQTRDAALQLVSSVARMATQAGKGVGEKAGWGYVGMINGFTVKLATHHNERSTSTGKAELQRSCDELRTSLKSAVDLLTKGAAVDAKVMKQIYKNLGLDARGNELKGRPLITRTMALAVAKDLTKIVNDENFSHKMQNVRGEKTITHSRADEMIQSLGAAQEARDAFLDGKLKPLIASMVFGGEKSLWLKNVMERVSANLIIKTDEVVLAEGKKATEGKGTLAVQGAQVALDRMTDADVRKAMETGVDTLERCLNAIVGKNVDPSKFRNAIAVLYRKTVATNEWSAQIEEMLKPTTVQVPETKVPEIEIPPPGADRSFAIFKHLVSILPPTREKDTGKVSYPSYQSWLAEAAAGEFRKDVAELTLDDVKNYVSKHLEDKPRDLGATIEFRKNHEPCIPGFTYKLNSYFGEALGKDGAIADDAKFAELLAQGVNKQGRLPLGNLKAGDPALFNRGGGLFATNEETFTLNGAEITSVVTPKRKYENPQLQSVLANFAQTEVKKDGKTLFTALRFGSCPLMGPKDCRNVMLQRQHYGQLIEQMLRSNQKLLDEGLANGKVELPVCRVDMADTYDLAKYADTYEIKVGDKTVSVTPKVMHFRLATDSAFGTNKVDTTNWLAMPSADVASTDDALGMLLEAAERSKDPQVGKLKEQLKSFWSEIKNRHCDKTGALRLFEDYGAVMMKFGARVALLAHRLGNVPSFNCNGGRDRTGLMDVECKTLALWLDAGNELPEIAPGADEMTALRREVREKSGNQAIARQIKLNDHDMYLNQVGSHINHDLKLNSQNFQHRIPTYDGTSEVDWAKDNFSTGLSKMYETEKKKA